MILIFVPSNLLEFSSGFLFGDVETTAENSTTFYILGYRSNPSGKDSIGQYGNKTVPTFNGRSKNWITLSTENNELKLLNIKINGRAYENTQEVICLVYSQKSFYISELLFKNSSDFAIEGNHFQTLISKLEFQNRIKSKRKIVFSGILFLFRLLSTFLSVLTNLFEKLSPILKYSTFGLQMFYYLSSLKSCLLEICEKKSVSVKAVNYLLSVLIDTLAGIILLSWLSTVVSVDSFPDLFLVTAKNVVTTLRDLLQWLMGFPAGLKLNFAFNNILGKFFLYHTNLWWTFLVLISPALEKIFQIFLIFGHLGITFQASIVADLLSLVTVHVYCIYAYAARLYHIQNCGIVSLLRVFFGRKRNPLRNRVDSCHYSPDQLFIGTIGCTILIFLLPTTVLYYLVFTTMRLTIIILDGILTRIRYLLHTIPIYSTFLWVTRNPRITSSIHITPMSVHQTKVAMFTVTPIHESWWKTVVSCKPDFYNRPLLTYGIMDILPKLATGQLI